MTNKPGPATRIFAPLALLIPIGVTIACFWGLNWVWLPTSLLGMVAAFIIAAVIDGILQRRDAQAEIDRVVAAQKAHPLYPLGEAIRRAAQPKDPA